jgi:hypothetical protein
MIKKRNNPLIGGEGQSQEIKNLKVITKVETGKIMN